MESQIDDCARCEAYEEPAVEMVGIQYGILGKEEQRLDLGGVARSQGNVGIIQCPRDEAYAEVVVVIVDVLALHRRTDGEYHVEEPMVGCGDDSLALLGIYVVEDV